MRLLPAVRRVVPGFTLAAALGSGLAAREPQSEEPAVPLPRYVVTGERELPPPEEWLYAQIPGFEVLSNASERATKELLTSFQSFTNAVSLVAPGLVPRATGPAALIICGRGDQFSAFLPASARGAERATVSLSLRAREQAAIVLDLQTKELNLAAPEGVAAASAAALAATDENPAAAGGDQAYAVDAYQQLYREYLRFQLASLAAQPPPWFAEGLAQLFMAMQVTETSITLGKLEDPNATTEPTVPGRAATRHEGDFNAALARRALLPMPELFAMAADSPTALNPVGSAWAKQSSAFVHWGLYGDDGAHQKEFLTFLARLQREPATETLFKECFKQDYREMLFTLRSYLEFTRHKIAGVKAPKGQKLREPPPVVVRPATEAEVGRLKGETLRLAGQSAAARAAMIIPYTRGERPPDLLAALGLAEADGGDPAKARKLLEAAARAQVVRPRAYVELARLRLADARAHPAGAGGRLSAPQMASVLAPLFVARGQPHPLPALYELIAEAWAHSAVAPDTAQLAVLDEGVRLDLRNTALIYAAAALKAKLGRGAEAESLIRLGLRVAPDADTRAKFEALQATLPALPPAEPGKN